MKKLALLGLLVSMNVWADAAPIEWSLPNQGKDCSYVATFQPEGNDCGARFFETWSCLEGQKPVHYLIMAWISTDVPGHCSKIALVEKVIRQR